MTNEAKAALRALYPAAKDFVEKLNRAVSLLGNDMRTNEDWMAYRITQRMFSDMSKQEISMDALTVAKHGGYEER